MKKLLLLPFLLLVGCSAKFSRGDCLMRDPVSLEPWERAATTASILVLDAGNRKYRVAVPSPMGMQIQSVLFKFVDDEWTTTECPLAAKGLLERVPSAVTTDNDDEDNSNKHVIHGKY